ncbi:MAG: bifunctional diguanylate cyclase/phosphodiesterase [Acidimicrobiaceae bacterium]|nr:bifunctional diguanylate cyclase/phosphodiesterase [Acidimicrobiaceae bacterium]
MKLKTWVWKIVLAGGSVLIVGYFFLPNANSQNVVYGFVGMASVGAILLGVHLNAPKNRVAWYCVVMAGVLFTLGDDVYSVYGRNLHLNVRFPSSADALYLAAYPFLFYGVLSLTRSVNDVSQREDTADAAIIALGGLSLSWQFLINNYFNGPTVSMFGSLVNSVYPVMDIALIFILFRALFFVKSSSPCQRLVAMAVSVMFVADFIYDLLVLHGSYATGNAVDGLFLLEYVLIAAAALHPSMSAPLYKIPRTNPVGQSGRFGSRIRAPFVIVAGFVAPSILVISSSLHESVNVVALGIICIIVFAIIFLRLSWLIQRIVAQSFQLSDNLRDLELLQLQREKLESNLSYQALHDPLTGLANRTLFEDRLEHAQERAIRAGEMGAVLLLDLDDFKGVNDAFGHLVGDQLLVSIASRLEGVTRSSDMICRPGGDEFLYLAEGIADVGEAEAVAKRLLNQFIEPFVINSVRFDQHVSIGITVFDADLTKDRNFVQEADVALYQAKSWRRGNHVVFSPTMQESAVNRFTLVQELRDALRVGDVSMHYQPIVEIGTSEIVGFEALMRWQHPQRGMVPPDVFIPLAEQSDLIIALGEFALREALTAAKSWPPSGRHARLPYVAVNFSAQQFHQPDVVGTIEDALRLVGIVPNRLVIEITESVALLDVSETVKVLGDLARLGIGIALDDFGTGYSSLSYLVMLHPQIIKIDRSFVSPSRESTTNDVLLEEIIKLGQRLGITLLAEGIETEGQLARLRELGCELGQGFLFSPAVPADHVTNLLVESRERSDKSSPKTEYL